MASLEWNLSCSPVKLSLILLSFQVAGDYIQINPTIGQLDERVKAVLDTTLIHGGVAGISWLIVVNNSAGPTLSIGKSSSNYDDAIFDTLLCAALGILVDIDHFIAARSLSIKNAMKMTRRPAFHSTSLLLVTFITLMLISSVTAAALNRLFLYELKKIAFILLVAGLSHHLRDGIRHGLWFPPFGSTPPLPYWLYLASSLALPHCVKAWLPAAVVTEKHSTFYDYVQSA